MYRLVEIGDEAISGSYFRFDPLFFNLLMVSEAPVFFLDDCFLWGCFFLARLVLYLLLTLLLIRFLLLTWRTGDLSGGWCCCGGCFSLLMRRPRGPRGGLLTATCWCQTCCYSSLAVDSYSSQYRCLHHPQVIANKVCVTSTSSLFDNTF